MLVSFVFTSMNNDEVTTLLKFSDNTFFFVCLPPIVFASGFNMQRGNFFANIKNILILGVLSTFVCFGIFSILTVVLKKIGFMR